jgi:hypothetical protein
VRAHGIARRSRRHGYQLVSDPQGFILDDAYGPVRPAEIKRAKEWGAQLVRASVIQAGARRDVHAALMVPGGELNATALGALETALSTAISDLDQLLLHCRTEPGM